jgi:hypothetical protein
MQTGAEKRVDFDLRRSIDLYIEQIKEAFKISMYNTGAWDEDKVNQFCNSVRVSKRGDLLTISNAKKNIHSYIAIKNVGEHQKGSIFSVGWFGKPSLGYPIGNVMSGNYSN